MSKRSRQQRFRPPTAILSILIQISLWSSSISAFLLRHPIAASPFSALSHHRWRRTAPLAPSSFAIRAAGDNTGIDGGVEPAQNKDDLRSEAPSQPIVPQKPDDGRYNLERLESESRYPLKFPLLCVSTILAGKGLSDALITIIKVQQGFVGASLTEEFIGVPVLGIDTLCVAAGVGLGVWTWRTMVD
mmetsp:Transcript_20117/g.40061  ORF Transcript_20117/g.40061 Transcript_20117/m.40061 type:complete len:188 (-) Transcript_20117:146-709(-)